jgi:predicted metallopeptidase
MIEYERSTDLEREIRHLIKTLDLAYMDPDGLICLRSRGSQSKAIAWCHGLPSVWQTALSVKARYVIEVVSERFDVLPEAEKTRVLVHELMHIPRTFSGGIRPHRPYHFARRVNEMVRRLGKNDRG